MSVLADELLTHTDEIVHHWYERWRRSAAPHTEVSEAALKDHLPPQLRLIGEQLHDLAAAESPEHMWKITERLAPELRFEQDIAIEEVVKEYGLVVHTVRDWIEERGLEVPFREYSYFHAALFELAAESVRRFRDYQARAVSQDRAHYLASVMHQLRTPLTALTLHADSLGKRVEAVPAAFVDRIRRSVRRLRLLVDGVLRLERFHADEQPVAPREIHPAHVLAELIEDLRHDADSKHLGLAMHVRESLRMRIDPDLFTDTLGNLLQNAIKFTDRGSVTLDAEERPSTVVFRVHDSGPGISAEKRAQLLSQAVPGERGGAGIGLLIAKHAAEAQGGRIGIDSEPGRGSTFWVELPGVVEARHDAVAPESPSP